VVVRGKEDGRSELTTVYHLCTITYTFCSSLRSSPSLILTLFAIRFAHRSFVEPFTVENFMMTPKMSIRRHVAIISYESEISKMYGDE